MGKECWDGGGRVAVMAEEQIDGKQHHVMYSALPRLAASAAHWMHLGPHRESPHIPRQICTHIAGARHCIFGGESSIHNLIACIGAALRLCCSRVAARVLAA